MAWDVEVTDTFGGEANYCWVRRYRIDAMPERVAQSSNANQSRWLVRKAKELAGYSGVRGRSNYSGDMIEWRPYRILHVMFITWSDEHAPSRLQRTSIARC